MIFNCPECDGDLVELDSNSGVYCTVGCSTFYSAWYQFYPNSLYAKVSIDYWNNTVTLVRGHGYPYSSIGNGFG
jgi:hypothetical protein